MKENVLVQTDGQWQKLLTMLLWKIVKTDKITLTHDEIQACVDAFEGEPCLYTHGHEHSIDFQVVSRKTMEALAKQHPDAQTRRV